MLLGQQSRASKPDHLADRQVWILDLLDFRHIMQRDWVGLRQTLIRWHVSSHAI
jgi:hypothetical protein